MVSQLRIFAKLQFIFIICALPLIFGHIHGQTKQAVNFSKFSRSKWPNNTILFRISPDFSEADQETILRGIDEWNEKISCLKVAARDTENDYVEIFPGQSCYTHLGHIGGQQEMSLDPDTCLRRPGAMLIYLTHAAGITAHQKRTDRDNYIRIYEINIPEDLKKAFAKNDPKVISNFGPYNYYSLMHAPVFFPGTNLPAFRVLKPGIDVNRIGHARTFNQTDIDLIHQLYC